MSTTQEKITKLKSELNALEQQLQEESNPIIIGHLDRKKMAYAWWRKSEYPGEWIDANKSTVRECQESINNLFADK